MKLRKQTIDDVMLRDKRVIIRADFNVPLDDEHQITDDTRIRSTLPTINRAVDDGAKVILCSHLGRPDGKVNPKYSLAPVAKRLGRLMGKDILFARDCIGPVVEGLVAQMKPGDVMLLENLRFHEGEEDNDDAFSKALASLGDVYINDAFGTAHRAHASTVGIKTHIAVALAVAACRAGFTVYFTSLDDMVRHLTAADDIGRLTRKLHTYLRPNILVIDEVGYQPLERAQANLVFQVISKRYEKGSTLLTSNKSFGEWGQVFGDEVLATAILDRLLHHCDVVAINGPSYRLKNRLTAIDGQANVA